MIRPRHGRTGMASQGETGAEIGLDHRVPVIVVEVRQRLSPIDAGVVDQHVEPALVGDHRFEAGRSRGPVGYIERRRRALVAIHLKLGDPGPARVAGSRPLSTTRAPASAMHRAMAQPRPRVAPVTSAIFPSSEKAPPTTESTTTASTKTFAAT